MEFCAYVDMFMFIFVYYGFYCSTVNSGPNITDLMVSLNLNLFSVYKLLIVVNNFSLYMETNALDDLP